MRVSSFLRTTVFVAAFAGSAVAAWAAPQEWVPTGQAISPTAARGARFEALNPDLPGLPQFTAGQASAAVLSPDGRTLLVMTSGYNRNVGSDGAPIAALSNEYIFVYDVAGPAPIKRQVLTVSNTFLGLAWAASGERFYVSGGVDDDVLEYARTPAGFALKRSFPLGHKLGLGLDPSIKPETAGVAVSPDGTRLLAANLQNDSVSLIDLSSAAVAERDLRPGVIDPKHAGEPGGTFPKAVIWASDTKAYVASQRDREIIVLEVAAGSLHVDRRIKTRGQPVALALNRSGSRLYAGLDNTDGVAVVDTAEDRMINEISMAAAPGGSTAGLGGAGADNLALSADGRFLWVVEGGENAVALVGLSARDAGLAAAKPRGDKDGDGDDRPQSDRSAVLGLIPTGWYPTAVAVRPDNGQLYVVNGKSNAGPDPAACRASLDVSPATANRCASNNQYVWQLEKAGLLSLPMPTPAELGVLTRQVLANNHADGAGREAAAAQMAFLRAHIRHVIYVVKENRTYDQVLGDLEVGNGDPRLALFDRAMTPNQHALARQFVDLDNFLDSGESSNTGWNWTTAARTNDFTEREAPVNYADRGLQYDQEGQNRNINVGLATPAERIAFNPINPKDPDLLPGAVDVAAPDGPDGEAGRGYLWDAALRAGRSVRNWGFYGDLTRYFSLAGPSLIPLEREPWKTGLRVFFPTKAALMKLSDPYYRGFDQAFPDYWRFKAWEREFDGFAASGKAPELMLVRLPHDHTGAFGKGLDGVDTVETEVADNDYAVGLLVDKVAKSPFAKDTLIFVVEDDAQDGPDHVDAHRSIAFVAGPYVKQGAVVSRRYTSVNMVRTIELVLGLAPLGLNDALADPMAEVFDPNQPAWRFDARVPAVLRSTKLPLPPLSTAQAGCTAAPRRSASWWAAAMKGQNFNEEDRLNTVAFNAALWRGLKGDAAYPTARGGHDLRNGRARLLTRVDGARCSD